MNRPITLQWAVIGWLETAYRTTVPNVWAAEFGEGYLVLHASPSGAETMVYVPHAQSGLWPAESEG